MTSLFWVLFGTIFGIVMICLAGALAFIEKGRKKEVSRRLGKTADTPARQAPRAPVFVEAAETASRGSAWESLPVLRPLSKQIHSSGLDWRPEMVALAMAGLGILGALLGWIWPLLLFRGFSSLAIALVLGGAPFLYIRRARSKRLGAFESQFPDTLDFFARAIRAGHAFSVSLELLANESPEPTRTEFRRVFTEHNLGAPIESALDGLVHRVPLVDVRFFVSAVLLQRETGGNLSEILDNLARVIRDRFTLKGKVRAASAHGRMTAIALSIIPVVIFAGMAIVSPGYVQIFREDDDARLMFVGCIVGQFLSYLWMKKIVNIKV